MRKVVVLLAVFVFLAGPVYAQQASSLAENCGCGIGTMAFKDQEGLVFQVIAATTNGIFGNQTFGISSGTLGCEQPASLASNERVKTFVAENMDNLAVDIAAGKGETLDALADLMEMPAGERAAFYTTLQSHFGTIYSSADVTHIDVVGAIAELVERS